MDTQLPLEGLLPAPQPMTVAERRVQMSYRGPRVRNDRCATCKHLKRTTREADTPFEHDTLRCSRGHFEVQLGGICDVWSKP